jgi:4-carboxymuconolactone decarboxylase
MSVDENKQRGIELLARMLGENASAATRESWEKIAPDLEEYITGFVFGDVWSRPGLDLRTKSLVTIATVAATGRTLALELNIRMALRNGATREEIIETLLQLAPYAGFPAAWEALAMAHKVFESENK